MLHRTTAKGLHSPPSASMRSRAAIIFTSRRSARSLMVAGKLFRNHVLSSGTTNLNTGPGTGTGTMGEHPRTPFCYVCNHIRIEYSKTGQHERGHLKRPHEARSVLYRAYEVQGAEKRYLKAAKSPKWCYLLLTPALDLAMPASTRVPVVFR